MENQLKTMEESEICLLNPVTICSFRVGQSAGNSTVILDHWIRTAKPLVSTNSATFPRDHTSAWRSQQDEEASDTGLFVCVYVYVDRYTYPTINILYYIYVIYIYIIYNIVIIYI